MNGETGIEDRDRELVGEYVGSSAGGQAKRAGDERDDKAVKTKNWKFARTLREMPSKSGRYLFMNQLGTFFVGVWNAGERSLHTQTIGFHYDDKDRRVTDGRIYMARWSFRDNGHVFWREPDEPLDFYRIWRRVMMEAESNG